MLTYSLLLERWPNDDMNYQNNKRLQYHLTAMPCYYDRLPRPENNVTNKNIDHLDNGCCLDDIHRAQRKWQIKFDAERRQCHRPHPED